MTDFCYLEVDDIAAGWLDTILWVAAQPQRKAFHTVTRILDAGVDGNPRIHRAAADLLADVRLPGVRTVANTIFPAAMAAQTPDVTALGARYQQVFPELRRLDRNNRNGTYFHRLVAYPGATGTTNQLERIVSALTVELGTNGPKRARYEATLETPAEAADPLSESAPIFEPSKDSSPMGFPCLSFLSFQHDCSSLHAVAHYRSQWLMQRGLGNYLGIARLQRYLADQAGLSAGHLTVVVGHAHADHLRQDRIAALAALRQDLAAATSGEATLREGVR
ncbi:hypothetical protein SBI67_14280 [Mycolicibacterium sp. 120266]|uniref:hypothetical protein n=1 Tax=Mycolicibacterium sp. 120266 TaxID=3090601 RepID=UPI00299EF071|nr:hypothetical protein [Mycolicibacterium sp. 120266]MDX1873288.1 hypothetical protein [Mycolicibacterium sp. 120266]